MVFEGVDSTLSGIPVVYMWWDQLKGAIVSHDCIKEGSIKFVVHDMSSGGMLGT